MSDFPQFVLLVSSKVGTSVNRLPDVSVVCPLNEFTMERLEYRLSKSKDETSGILVSERLASSTGEKALVEVGSDLVRLSLKIAYEGPDASVLTRDLESKFFKRLARTGVACIRRKSIENYDLTLLFTCHDCGYEVEKLLLHFLPICRKLSKQIRLSQVIENRRAGRNVFSKLVQVVPKPRPMTAFSKPETESSEVGDGTIESIVTEYGDIGNIEDFKDDDVDKNDDIFLI